MERSVTRRDVLKVAGGSALGLLFTPVPWKLLSDSSVWTQNWEAIAKLPRGPVSLRPTTCTLCPVGCAAQARCVAGVPFALVGQTADPLGRGGLCAAGLSSHQVPWHPARLRAPRRRTRPGGDGGFAEISLEEALSLVVAAIGQRNAAESVVVIDDRPGRVRSRVYRAFLEGTPGGVYVPNPSRSSRPLETIGSCAGVPGKTLAIDPRRARAILSFGAPLLDGYGGPGFAGELLRARRETGYPRILAAEARLSRTASLADRWFAVRPGSEPILALGLAHVLLRDRLVAPVVLDGARREAAGAGGEESAYAKLVAQFTPDRVAGQTGMEPAAIEQLARTLALGPAVVLGLDPATGAGSTAEELSIWGLNLLLSKDTVLRFAELPPDGLDPCGALRVAELESLPDQSARVILLDESGSGGALSAATVRRKLAPGGLLVSLSPWDFGLARSADLQVPAPAPLEMPEESVGAPLLGPQAYRLSLPLLDPPAGATDPITFVRLVAESLGTSIAGPAGSETVLELARRRVDAIQERGRGRLVRLPEGETSSLAELLDPEALWSALRAGGVWIDDEVEVSLSGISPLGDKPEEVAAAMSARLETPPPQGLVAVLSSWNAGSGPAAAAPLLTKLGQESELREGAPQAWICPQTAGRLGLVDGQPVRIETSNGTLDTIVRSSASVGLEVLQVALGPGYRGLEDNSAAVADLFLAGDPSAPRVLPARLREV